MKLKATDRYHSTPISPRLASNFIELGYGLQVEGMAAEMLFNRSFEPFYPYRMINKLWYDLLEDENDLSSRCETDWRVFDWYHSSYEHNAWFAFPGTAGYQPICDDSTFVIEQSPLAAVNIALVEGGCHGRYAMRVVNHSSAPGGLAQDGKYCVPGTVYRFRGKVRCVEGAGERLRGLRAALFSEGTVEAPVAEAALGEVGPAFTPVNCEFTVPAAGRYTFVLLLPPGSAAECDDFSLQPVDAIGGFKQSAVEAGRYVAPKVIRWPGGCFASFYNWREGVGPARQPAYSYFWGGYQYNDIGTDELAAYAEAVGGESMVCVNVYHPFKRFYEYVPPDQLAGDPNDPHLHAAPHGRDLPEFTDKETGAREAAAWVEYCNGGPDTEGGRARAANGRVKPYNIKYWELDNEIHRWYSAEEYAEVCVLYSKAMKAVDPTIRIGMISYCYGNAALRPMLEICGKHIDFLADRGIDERELEFKLSLLEEYNAAHGTDIRYCNTEWLPLNGADVYNMVPRSETRHNKVFLFSKWTYALDAAAMMLMWQRHGDRVDFINFNNLANTHSQSVIETPKEGAYITAAGMVMHRFAHTAAYRTLVLEQCEGPGDAAGDNAAGGAAGDNAADSAADNAPAAAGEACPAAERAREYHPKRDDPVSVQLSMNQAGSALVLNVLNRGTEDGACELELAAYGITEAAQLANAEGVMLSAPDLLSMNTLDDQEIRETAAPPLAVSGGIVLVPAPRLSFSEYVIPLSGR